MKRLIFGLLAAATLVTGAGAAEAQRRHGGDHHGGYNRGYHPHRWGHAPHHRRGYWYYRHGHRYHGWR